MHRRLFLLLSTLLILPRVAPAARAGSLRAHFEVSDPSSAMVVDHTAWAGFLGRYVKTRSDSVNLVAYGAVTTADRRALQAYIASLEATPVSLCSRAEQLAFWANLYNALTVGLVLQHYPVGSIRDIGGPASSPVAGPWGEMIAHVEGLALSLEDIESHILLPIWSDPRVLYALSCAAISCPSLRSRPYSASRIDHQLDVAAMAYVNSPQGLRILGGRLVVSKLYEWHEAAFGGSEGGILRHLLAYASPDTAMRLQRIHQIDGFQFDWALNGVR